MNPDESTAKEKIFQAAMELVTEGKTEQQKEYIPENHKPAKIRWKA